MAKECCSKSIPCGVSRAERLDVAERSLNGPSEPSASSGIAREKAWNAHCVTARMERAPNCSVGILGFRGNDAYLEDP
jgi:hypothetical protein